MSRLHAFFRSHITVSNYEIYGQEPGYFRLSRAQDAEREAAVDIKAGRVKTLGSIDELAKTRTRTVPAVPEVALGKEKREGAMSSFLFLLYSQNIRTLGDVGSNLLTELTRQGKRLFTFDDAAKIYGNSNGGLRRLLHTLVKRRWLRRIEKGKYLILPFEAGREGEWTEHEFIIASYLINPYYIAFRSALNYYGYTEQVSRTIFVASTRRKLKSALEISGVIYRFVYMPTRKFFGATEVTLDGYRVNISEREKTIVDCLDRLEYCGGVVEVAKALYYGRDELDSLKIAEYARRNGNRAAIQRLGYLLETLDAGTDEAITLLRDSISNSYAPLDTLATPKGRYIDRWKILVNVPQNELLQWKER